jgi:hypothetical protein
MDEVGLGVGAGACAAALAALGGLAYLRAELRSLTDRVRALELARPRTPIKPHRGGEPPPPP